jgi:putative hydrolase of the HAD superfamily
VSNFEAWLEEWFGIHELVEIFPVRVISGIEGIEKPDRRMFRLALERAGVDAVESAYVGDNPEFDVDPPAALGMFPVLVDRRDRFPHHAGARIRDLRDLPAILEGA